MHSAPEVRSVQTLRDTDGRLDSSKVSYKLPMRSFTVAKRNETNESLSSESEIDYDSETSLNNLK